MIPINLFKEDKVIPYNAFGVQFDELLSLVPNSKRHAISTIK